MTTRTKSTPRQVDQSAPAVAPIKSEVGEDSLDARYRRVRASTDRLCDSLHIEDYVVQNAPEVSPTKWHLAHTTWFFETFVLERWLEEYKPINPAYRVLFNSYYNAVGSQFPKAHRGTLSRPTVQDVLNYRDYVDDHMSVLLMAPPDRDAQELADLVVLGMHHEQQHQELILTDIKHVFGANPLLPAYRKDLRIESEQPPPPLDWIAYDGGIREIGHKDPNSFAYDNECPRHRVFLENFEIASRLITNGEYLEFMKDGGYDRPELWLAEGWCQRNESSWRAPLHWIERDGSWFQYTLGGVKPLDLHEPVCHVNSYETHAYARWAGARLPTEFEWETACPASPEGENFVEQDRLHPKVAATAARHDCPLQMFGDVWEWTSSAYLPYPGFAAAMTAVGEYNGKFMSNQMALRGGSCVTARSHVRCTYRNFFPPDARWQFTGFRLARTPRP